MRLIDADEIIARCNFVIEHGITSADGSHPITAEVVLEVLKETPSIDVGSLVGSMLSAQPQRKKGEWEEIEVIPEAYDIAGAKTWASKMRCNQCGFTTFAIEGRFAQYDFCPSCGADMRGEIN